jgi:hypothetical protein
MVRYLYCTVTVNVPLQVPVRNEAVTGSGPTTPNQKQPAAPRAALRMAVFPTFLVVVMMSVSGLLVTNEAGIEIETACPPSRVSLKSALGSGPLARFKTAGRHGGFSDNINSPTKKAARFQAAFKKIIAVSIRGWWGAAAPATGATD